MRFAYLFACLAVTACVNNDDPTLHVDVTQDGSVAISVARAPDHTFGRVRATVNGVDAGPATISVGHDPGWNTSPFADQPAPAIASFLVQPAQIGASLHLSIDDDGDRYVLDVPDFGSPRTPTVVSALDAPLRPNAWVEVATGIDSDRIGDGMEGKLNDTLCFTQWATEIGAGTTRLQLPPDFSSWGCGPLPADGSPVAIKLELDLQVWPAIATCSGRALTCDPIVLNLPATVVDASVQN